MMLSSFVKTIRFIELDADGHFIRVAGKFRAGEHK